MVEPAPATPDEPSRPEAASVGANPADAETMSAAPQATDPAAARPAPGSAGIIAGSPASAAKPVIFPVAHAPDDPGPETEPPGEPRKSGFRLFG
jgi:HemY protein